MFCPDLKKTGKAHKYKNFQIVKKGEKGVDQSHLF